MRWTHIGADFRRPLRFFLERGAKQSVDNAPCRTAVAITVTVSGGDTSLEQGSKAFLERRRCGINEHREIKIRPSLADLSQDEHLFCMKNALLLHASAIGEDQFGRE